MSSSDSEKPNQKKPVSTLPGNQGSVNTKVKQKKIGHRRVDASTGQTTYKKTPSEALSSCIQLGISHTVAKLSAKTERDVLLQDFQTVESIPFPPQGSNITPAHHNGDFVFSTYAPTAFRYFRDLFGIQPEDYMLSISRYPLVELSNPGASGSLFFVTHDDEFIIKTVQAKEATFLQRLLPGYYMNIVQNPRTLLPKFYGLYTVNLGTRHTIRVVVMNNLLPRKIQMHLKFDLKGSTHNRKASKTERQKTVPTFKDLDLISDHPKGLLQVSSDIHAVLTQTLQRDCLVLQSFKIMDYSLLLAIHNIDKCKGQAQSQGNGAECNELARYWERSSLNKSTASGISSNDPEVTSSANNLQGVRNSQSVLTSTMLRNKYNADLDHWSGGIPAKNYKGEKLLIFCGIIDILQCYKWKKKLEHRWKSIVADGDTVSVHRPGFYCERFLKFMTEKVFHEDVSTIKTQQPKRTSGSTYRKMTALGSGEAIVGSSRSMDRTEIKHKESTSKKISTSSKYGGETSFHKLKNGSERKSSTVTNEGSQQSMKRSIEASSSKATVEATTSDSEHETLESEKMSGDLSKSSPNKQDVIDPHPSSASSPLRGTSFLQKQPPHNDDNSSQLRPPSNHEEKTRTASTTVIETTFSADQNQIKQYKSTVTVEGLSFNNQPRKRKVKAVSLVTSPSSRRSSANEKVVSIVESPATTHKLDDATEDSVASTSRSEKKLLHVSRGDVGAAAVTETTTSGEISVDHVELTLAKLEEAEVDESGETPTQGEGEEETVTDDCVTVL